MADSSRAPERRARALMGVVAASALVYPLLVCAVQLSFAQLFAVDVAAIALWLALGVAVQRRGRGRRPLGRRAAGPQPVAARRAAAAGARSSSGWSGPKSRR